MPTGYLISERQHPTFLEVLDEHRRQRSAPATAPKTQAATSMLLQLVEDIETGSRGMAVPIVPAPTATKIQSVALVGLQPAENSQATYTLKISRDESGGEATDGSGVTEIEIAVGVATTAGEIIDAIADQISGLQVRGPVWADTSGNEYDSGRWYIWTDNINEFDLEVAEYPTDPNVDVLIRDSLGIPTESLRKVAAGIPMSDPTPLRAGAIVTAQNIAGFGLVVSAAEYREWHRVEL